MERSRQGLTLVEWIVVIVVIGIMLVLLLPAVNEPRRVLRRVSCSVNLKNLALAAFQHENSLGHFPGFVQDYGTWTAGPNPVDPSDLNANKSTLVSHRKIGTWTVALLPWLDGQPTYEHWTVDRYPIVFGGSKEFLLSSGRSGTGFTYMAAPNLETMQCPSDPMDDGGHGRNSYICNTGMYHRGHGGEPTWTIRRSDSAETVIDFSRSMIPANGVFNNKFSGLGSDGQVVPLGPPVTMDDITDGKSNTMLFSESLQAVSWHRAGLIDASDLVITDDQEIRFTQSSRYTQGMVWHYEDDELTDGASPVDPVHRINGVPPGEKLFELEMTKRNAADIARPSSAHSEGVNASFADGSTRFISETIDYRVYQAMLTPRGTQSDVPQQSYLLTDELLGE